MRLRWQDIPYKDLPGAGRTSVGIADGIGKRSTWNDRIGRAKLGDTQFRRTVGSYTCKSSGERKGKNGRERNCLPLLILANSKAFEVCTWVFAELLWIPGLTSAKVRPKESLTGTGLQKHLYTALPLRGFDTILHDSRLRSPLSGERSNAAA